VFRRVVVQPGSTAECTSCSMKVADGVDGMFG
jgi:predicted dithiol-disulfide oxidoreductase (DUF899 family)